MACGGTAAVGLDRRSWLCFDADLASGKYGLVDSMLVIRCGKQAYRARVSSRLRQDLRRSREDKPVR